MKPKPSGLPAVTAAAIVAILFGVFGVFTGILTEITLLLGPRLASVEGRPALPVAVRAASQAAWLFLLGLAVFGIFTGVGILRRRNWARVSILIWAGLMAFYSAITIPILLLVWDKIPATLPNASEAAPVMAMMKWVMAGLYTIPLGVGLWWLILFTRPRVVVSFRSVYAALHPGMAVDASDLPQTPPAPPSYPPRGPACPLPLIIVAGLDIFSGVSMLIFVFVPIPLSMPLFLFGHAFGGVGPRMFLGAIGAVYTIAGVGILKLKPWALNTLIVFKSLFLMSGIVSMFNPRFFPLMQEAIAKAMPDNPIVSADSFLFVGSFLRPMMLFSFVLAVGLLAILFVYRARFLEAAEAARKSAVPR